ncbi:MAG: hypothetical protein ABSB94_02905 [Syntrophorhabdales bacterium]
MAESGYGRRGSRAARQGSNFEGATGYPLAGVQVIDIPCGWVPRPDQRTLWDYLERGGKRAVCVAHRRWGKDDVALHFTATQMIQRPGNYWHMLPQANQARKVVWDAINPKTGKRRVDEAFPKEIRRKIHEQEMFIEFANGSTWQLVGSDNYNSLVGSAPAGIVFSEYAVADPMAWAYLRPILAANEGWALFIYTPRGANHGKSLYDFARAEPGWFATLLPADRTPVFTPDRLNQERRELLAEFGETEGEMLFLQEYYCSFEGMVRGAYYSKQLRAARSDGRITAVPHAAGHEVYTFWDLGMDDSTSIWFMQAIGRELRFIDYYEASGEGLAHYAKVLKERPYVYGDHYMPHDADVRELGTGTSRKATAENLGIRPVVVVQRARDTQAVLSGIEAGRNIMSQCWFDERKCAHGLSALEGYQAEYDEEKKKLADHPLHNWCSHGADAWRTMAVGWQPRVKHQTVTSVLNGIPMGAKW